MSANERQVGGDHYKTEYEHWDWVENNGIGYLEGCASKYVSRWRKKNGVQDLEKALHYVDKLIELGRPNRVYIQDGIDKVGDDTVMFCEANELDPMETVIIIGLATWADKIALLLVKIQIQRLIKNAATTIQA